MPVKVLVTGTQAYFPRPGTSQDRRSYPVLTYPVARSLIEAIHGVPAIRWFIDTIEVLEPIRFNNATSIGGTIRYLLNVRYLVTAHFDAVSGVHASTPMTAQRPIFERRLRQQRFQSPPFLGAEDCPAILRSVAKDEQVPSALSLDEANSHLGLLPIEGVSDILCEDDRGEREAWLVNGIVSFRKPLALTLV